MLTSKDIINQMEALTRTPEGRTLSKTDEQRRVLMRFFKTGPGEYG